MNKNEFYNNVLNAMRDGIEQMEKEQERIADNIARQQKRIDSKMFSTEYIRDELQPEIKRLEKESAELTDKLVRQLCGMCDDYIAKLKADDDLKPEELTDDIRLLTAGITLNESDIRAMLKRNASNRTMSQILLRFASEHGFDTGQVYVGNQPTVEAVEALAGTIPTVVKWHDRPDVFNQLLGEGSDLAMAFGGDE